MNLSWLKHTLQQAAWAPLLVIAFYAVAAEGFDAYIAYPWLDMPTHFCGGLAVCYFYLVAIAHGESRTGPVPPIIHWLAALGLTAITAVGWEFFEYSCDVLLGTKMNLGVSDTLSDLFFGLLGGAVMVAFAALRKPVM